VINQAKKGRGADFLTKSFAGTDQGTKEVKEGKEGKGWG